MRMEYLISRYQMSIEDAFQHVIDKEGINVNIVTKIFCNDLCRRSL